MGLVGAVLLSDYGHEHTDAHLLINHIYMAKKVAAKKVAKKAVAKKMSKKC